MKPLPDLGEHLVILSPHDDDAALGAGGLILKRSAAGKKTTVLVMTDGSLGYSSPEEKDSIIGTREEETRKCYAALGAKVIFLGFPDMGLHPYRCWRTPDGRGGAYMITLATLRELDASALLLPNPADRHPDHQAAYDIGKVAGWQACSPIAAELGDPIDITHAFSYAVWDPLPDATHVLGLAAKELEGKKGSLSAYESQGRVISGLLEQLSESEMFQQESLI